MRVVITTIRPPTPCTEAWDRVAATVIVGDAKTPDHAWSGHPGYLSLAEQHRRWPKLAQMIPTGHYARKNLGYLACLEAGDEWLFETDDDNAPVGDVMLMPPARPTRVARGASLWTDPYALHGRPDVWHRGLPATARGFVGQRLAASAHLKPSAVQFLIEGEPDRCALQRVVERPEGFVHWTQAREDYLLDQGVHAPWNSQATMLRASALRAFYLPCTVIARLSDILRGYRALAMGYRLVLSGTVVCRQWPRNDHDLLRDLRDEYDLVAKRPYLTDDVRSLVAYYGGDPDREHDTYQEFLRCSSR